MPAHPKAAEKTNPNSASQKQRANPSSLQQMTETWHQPAGQSHKPGARGGTFPAMKFFNISPAQISPPEILISFEASPYEAPLKVSAQLQLIRRRSISACSSLTTLTIGAPTSNNAH